MQTDLFVLSISFNFNSIMVNQSTTFLTSILYISKRNKASYTVITLMVIKPSSTSPGFDYHWCDYLIGCLVMFESVLKCVRSGLKSSILVCPMMKTHVELLGFWLNTMLLKKEINETNKRGLPPSARWDFQGWWG